MTQQTEIVCTRSGDLPAQGLRVDVLADRGWTQDGIDCTAGGVTSQHNDFVLLGDGIAAPFEPSDDTPALALVYDLEPAGAAPGYLMAAKPEWLAKLADRPAPGQFECLAEGWAQQHRLVRVRAVPVIDGKPQTGGSFGGNYIDTSDSRMPVHGPIPVFDRFEGRA